MEELLADLYLDCFLSLSWNCFFASRLGHLQESMKEMIKFCMTQHEAEIRKLAETPLGGQRFELLIRRYEMYNEPLPEESKPDSSYVTLDFRNRPARLSSRNIRNH